MHANELLSYKVDYSSQDSVISPTDVDKQNTHTADPRSSLLANSRITPFPGSLYNMGSLQGCTVGSNPSENPSQGNADYGSLTEPKEGDRPRPGIRAQFAELPKSRKRSGEVEEANIHTTSPKEQPPAEFEDWESMKDLVAFVESIWDLLDHTRIHIVSTVDIEELASKRDLNHKLLWSWYRDDKDQFKSPIGPLLREKGFQLQMVSANRASIPRNYSTVSERIYWISHYELNDSVYWLAILSPEPKAGQSRKKMRRMVEYSQDE